VSCGSGCGALLVVGTGVRAPDVIAVGVAFAVLIEEEEVDEERSERPTALRKRSLSAIAAVLERLFSSKVEEKVRIQRRSSRDLFLLVCTLLVAGLDWTVSVQPLSVDLEGMSWKDS
jgi:hypothetical protein